MLVDAVRVVNEPAAAAVPPIAGGDARYVLNPVPLTVELADRVVNAPVFAVVAPTVPLMLMEAVPVRLVTTPEAGVPNAGVVKTGLVSVLFVSVSVVARPTNVSVAAGSVRVVVPATAVACNVVVPDVEPEMSIAFGLSVTVVAMIRPIKVCYLRRCWKAQ
jgi:hypothetical protein